MDIHFVDAHTRNFDSKRYIQMLIAIAKADRYNGPREQEYVRMRARELGLDFEKFWQETDKNFDFSREKTSRLAAAMIIKDSIYLASLDGNFTLEEKARVYQYAEKMDFPKRSVDLIEDWLKDYKVLEDKWNEIVAIAR